MPAEMLATAQERVDFFAKLRPVLDKKMGVINKKMDELSQMIIDNCRN